MNRVRRAHKREPHPAREWGNEEDGGRKMDAGYLNLILRRKAYVRVPKLVR